MIDTTTSAVATATIATVGTWAEGKGVNMKTVVGGAVLAIFLALISAANDQLGRQFAVLILVAALMRYAVPISKKLGYTK